MLADLKLVNCYDESFPNREQVLIKSAKDNLQKLAYFGLKSYWSESLFLFEKTFNVTLSADIVMDDGLSSSTGSKAYNSLTSVEQMAIKEMNKLDLELYHYAENLFLQRYEIAKKMSLQH